MIDTRLKAARLCTVPVLYRSDARFEVPMIGEEIGQRLDPFFASLGMFFVNHLFHVGLMIVQDPLLILRQNHSKRLKGLLCRVLRTATNSRWWLLLVGGVVLVHQRLHIGGSSALRWRLLRRLRLCLLLSPLRFVVLSGLVGFFIVVVLLHNLG